MKTVFGATNFTPAKKYQMHYKHIKIFSIDMFLKTRVQTFLIPLKLKFISTKRQPEKKNRYV